MAILTKSGRTAMAQAIAEQSIFLGWGRGHVEWDSQSEPESVTTTELLDAVGYRIATQVRFCLPDADGEIEVSSGNYAFSDTPTQHLYLQFKFDFADAAGEDLRELAVHVGAAAKAEQPVGQKYFAPNEMATLGQLLLSEHRQVMHREAGVRETFNFVVTF